MKLPWLMILCVMLLLITVMQLALGANPIVVLLAVATCSVGAWPLFGSGKENLGAVLVFVFMANCVLWGIIAKTVLLQPLDLYLSAPLETFAAEFVVTLEFALAFFVASRIKLGKEALKPGYSINRLTRLMILSAVIGVGLWVAHRLLFTDARSASFTHQADFGGFGVFQALVFFSITCATIRRIMLSNGKSTVDIWVASLLVLSILMMILDNDKREVAQAGLAYLLPSIYVRRRVSFAQMFTATAGILVVSLVVTPVIQQLRMTGFRLLSLQQRVEMMLDVLPKMLDGSQQAALEYAVTNSEQRDGTAYFGSNSLLLGRFVSLRYDDPVIAAVDRQAPLGMWVIAEAAMRTLPSVVNSDKGPQSTNDDVLWRLGLRLNGLIAFPVVPVTAMSYASGGWLGLLIFPFILFLMLLFILKKVGWWLSANVFALFVMSQLLITISSLSVEGLISFEFRTLPELLLVVLGADFISRTMPRIRLWKAYGHST